MYKLYKELAIGALIGAVLVSSIVYLKQTSENIERFLNNIKIYFNSREIIPRNVNIIELKKDFLKYKACCKK